LSVQGMHGYSVEIDIYVLVIVSMDIYFNSS
jgi:hypothetical protein